MTEPSLTATLLANGPYARDDAPYALLEVAGPDAGAFLQRLCTQDVLGLAAGEVAPAAFLDAKGKVQFTVLIWPHGDGFCMETQQEQRQRLLELLGRDHKGISPPFSTLVSRLFEQGRVRTPAVVLEKGLEGRAAPGLKRLNQENRAADRLGQEGSEGMQLWNAEPLEQFKGLGSPVRTKVAKRRGLCPCNEVLPSLIHVDGIEVPREGHPLKQSVEC